MPAYFAYYRVSTQKQGASGLGLEAQQAAVVSFLKGGQPQGEYVEVESSKKNQRPQLLAAMRVSFWRCATRGWTLSAATCPMPIP